MCKRGIPYPNGQCDVCGAAINPGLHGQDDVVFSDESCIFNYCPTPDVCRERGCQHRADGDDA